MTKAHSNMIINVPECSRDEAESGPSHKWYLPWHLPFPYPDSPTALTVYLGSIFLINHFIQILGSESTSERIQPTTNC